jgi:(p)ppGpp synthase/HD superfamily hydrolase
MTELVKQLDLVAEEYHKGQRRKTGAEYITHPRAVREIAIELFNKYGLNKQVGAYDRLLEDLEILALFHDVLEDCGILPAQLIHKFNQYMELRRAEYLVEKLSILNKRMYTSYFNYIMGVKFDTLTNLTKQADLKHNMSDLEQCSLKDKYALALFVLEQEKS